MAAPEAGNAASQASSRPRRSTARRINYDEGPDEDTQMSPAPAIATGASTVPSAPGPAASSASTPTALLTAHLPAVKPGAAKASSKKGKTTKAEDQEYTEQAPEQGGVTADGKARRAAKKKNAAQPDALPGPTAEQNNLPLSLLERLPFPAWDSILPHLQRDPVSMMRLSLTCRTIYGVIFRNEKVWKERCLATGRQKRVSRHDTWRETYWKLWSSRCISCSQPSAAKMKTPENESIIPGAPPHLVQCTDCQGKKGPHQLISKGRALAAGASKDFLDELPAKFMHNGYTGYGSNTWITQYLRSSIPGDGVVDASTETLQEFIDYYISLRTKLSIVHAALVEAKAPPEAIALLSLSDVAPKKLAEQSSWVELLVEDEPVTTVKAYVKDLERKARDEKLLADRLAREAELERLNAERIARGEEPVTQVGSEGCHSGNGCHNPPARECANGMCAPCCAWRTLHTCIRHGNKAYVAEQSKQATLSQEVQQVEETPSPRAMPVDQHTLPTIASQHQLQLDGSQPPLQPACPLDTLPQQNADVSSVPDSISASFTLPDNTFDSGFILPTVTNGTGTNGTGLSSLPARVEAEAMSTMCSGAKRPADALADSPGARSGPPTPSKRARTEETILAPLFNGAIMDNSVDTN